MSALHSALAHGYSFSMGPREQRPGGSGVGLEGQSQCTAARLDPLRFCTQGPASVSWSSSWRQVGALGWLMHHSWESGGDGKCEGSGEGVRG